MNDQPLERSPLMECHAMRTKKDHICAGVHSLMLHVHEDRERLRDALGSLQELLAKQIAIPEGDDLLCAACGLANDQHTERCPVARGLEIIEAAFKPHAQDSLEAK